MMHMEQIVTFLLHLSFEGWCTVVSCASGVIGTFGSLRNQTASPVYFSVYPPHFRRLERTRRVGCVSFSFVCITVLGLLLLLAIHFLPAGALTSFFQPATSHATAPQPLSPADQAQVIVRDFYNDLNSKNYQAAYSLLKSGWSVPYSQFAGGYRNTEYNDMTFDSIDEQVKPGTVLVTVDIKATENHPTGKQIHTYMGVYTIGKQNGTYKILSISLVEES